MHVKRMAQLYKVIFILIVVLSMLAIPAQHASASGAPYLKADPASGIIHAYGWAGGTTVHLTIDRPGYGGDIDYGPVDATVEQASWDPGNHYDQVAVFDLGGLFDLQALDVVTVTDGSTPASVETPVKLVPVRWFVGLGNSTDDGQLGPELVAVDDFNRANAGIELLLDVEPSNARDTLNAQIAAGNAPDVVGPDGWTAAAPFHDQWLDLTDLVSSTHYDTSQFNATLLTDFQTERGLEALPFAVYPAEIYYQKGLFDAAGLNYPPATYGASYKMTASSSPVVWNFDTMTEVAKLLTLDANGKNASETGFDKNHIVQYGFIPQYESTMALATFWGAGSLYSGTPGHYTAAIPAQWEAAWRWYYDGMWGDEPFIPNNQAFNTPEFTWNAFDSGKVAMALTQTWYTCCIGEAGSNWDLAVLPADASGTVHGLVHANSFRILQVSAHPDEAFSVMTYLIGDASASLLSAYGGTALPGRTADQAAYLADMSLKFPSVTHWDVMQAGLDYPDVPHSEGWMPNNDPALDRVNGFGGELSDHGGLVMGNALACLQRDLQNIFNNQPTLGCPNFSARFTENEVHGYSWRLGDSVDLTIHDPSGLVADHTDTQTVIVAPWDSSQTWVKFVLGTFVLKPGQIVTMSDGTITKTETVTDLTVTSVDPVADTVTGTAEPGSGVDVGSICDSSGSVCAFRHVTAGGSGTWVADFSVPVPGGNGDELNTFNIIPGTSNEARQSDVDGDSTNVQWRVPNPFIEASPAGNWVHGRDWPTGAHLTLTIDGATPGFEAVVGPASWNPSDIVADFDLGGYDLQAGQVLHITDGATERSYTLSDFGITTSDPVADTVSGIGTPGMDVQVCANVPGGCISRYVIPDGSGDWTVDYATPGSRDDEHQTLDLQPGMDGWANETDTNGNQTQADWHVLNPHIEASAGSNWVHGLDWPTGAHLTLTIDGATPGIEAVVGPASWDTSYIVADFDLGGYDLQAGQLLTITDGTTERSYTVTTLAITASDPDLDTVTGIATRGAEVQVCANVPNNCISRYVTADAITGAWTADYAHPGARDDEQQTVDLQPGNDGWATETDINSNQTHTDWHVANPSFDAWFRDGNINAYDWPVGNTLTLTIDDPATVPTDDYSTTAVVAVDPGNSSSTLAQFHLNGAFTIQPGMTLTVTDGTATKKLVISDLSVTNINPVTNTVTGTVGVNQHLWMYLDNSSGDCCRNFQANSSGHWSLDYSLAGSEGEQTEDIVSGSSGTVNAPDGDGDNTSVSWNTANADLDNLVFSTGALGPIFDHATFAYTQAVGNAINSLNVTPTVADGTATVTVNGTPVASGSASGAIALAVGPNTITTTVTSQDGITTESYTVTVTRARSSNANLSNLAFSTGALMPGFGAGTITYTQAVANAVSSLIVTPSVEDATATVKVNGAAVTSGSASGAIALAVGPNTITTVVTAQDGTTKTYTVTVTRARSSNANLSNLVLSTGALTPSFGAGTITYTQAVANAVSSLTVTPTVEDATATVKVNGAAVTSGITSGAIALAIGPNTITTAVTAQDGTIKTYTVTVTRMALLTNAALSNLVFSTGALSPVFDPATTAYTQSVANATASLTVTPSVADATATVTVNGAAVISGSASGAIALAVGPNTITTVVTAQDGTTTKTYTATVTRAAPAPIERLTNGGFNLYKGASKIPTGWVAANFAATDGKFTTAKKEGTASVKIAGATGKTKTLTQTLVLSGQAGDAFTFSFWAKGATIPAAGICQAQVLFYDGTKLKLTKTVPCKTGTYAVFQQKTLSFTVPYAYTKIVIKFTYTKAKGTVWFDAVSLMR